MYREGRSILGISKEIGKSYAYVRHRLLAMGVELRSSGEWAKTSDLKLKQVLFLRAEGYSSTEIGLILGVTKGTVNRRLRRATSEDRVV